MCGRSTGVRSDDWVAIMGALVAVIISVVTVLAG